MLKRLLRAMHRFFDKQLLILLGVAFLIAGFSFLFLCVTPVMREQGAFNFVIMILSLIFSVLCFTASSDEYE
jgi:hypothetical protein